MFQDLMNRHVRANVKGHSGPLRANGCYGTMKRYLRLQIACLETKNAGPQMILTQDFFWAEFRTTDILNAEIDTTGHKWPQITKCLTICHNPVICSNLGAAPIGTNTILR